MSEYSELFDFYGAHYRQFGSELASAMRREIYGEDLGQTGWRSAAEQAEIAALLELGPGRQLLDVGCGSGGPTLALAERTGCGVTGLDVETAGVAYSLAVASAQSLSGRAAFMTHDCSRPLPFADGTFDSVLCVDAINHLPDRPGTLSEWARLLRPGGRLLFTDPLVVTGPLSKPEIDVRSGLGFYLFVPPGTNEAAIAGAGLSLLQVADRSAAEADIAGRWHAVRARHLAELEAVEGSDWCQKRQRFLAVAAELARSGRLSRFLYLAQKPTA
ncbi:MAG: class I SAM-dependent methyltransferase [Geminicoccaceae bacterium]